VANTYIQAELEAGMLYRETATEAGVRRYAASLIGQFSTLAAAAEQKKESVNYPLQLHAAKKRIRQQEQWSSPYYWSTFVFVGPN